MTPLWSAQKPPSNNGVPLWGGEKPPLDSGNPLWKPISGIIIDIDTLPLPQRQALVASQGWHPVTLTLPGDVFLQPGQTITISGVRGNTCVLSVSGNGSFVVESAPNPRTIVYRNPSSAHGVNNVYVSTPSGCRIYSGVADNDYAPQLNGVPVLNKPAGDNPLWSPEKPPSNNGVPLWGGGKPAPDLDAALVWKPIWGSWGPDPSTVCLGEEFQQTRTHPTYGVEYRTAIGAREPIPIWDFDTPSGKTVSNFNILHSSQTLEVIWGDGSDSQVESGVNYAHTYL